jgi:hypothetical protein
MLARLTERSGNAVQVLRAIGEFVPAGAPLLRVYGPHPAPDEQLCAAIVLGEERTLDQDVGFRLRQLVDIADRALSPGVNDPTTAIQVIDQLHDLLRRLADRSLPPLRRGHDRPGPYPRLRELPHPRRRRDRSLGIRRRPGAKPAAGHAPRPAQRRTPAAPRQDRTPAPALGRTARATRRTRPHPLGRRPTAESGLGSWEPFTATGLAARLRLRFTPPHDRGTIRWQAVPPPPTRRAPRTGELLPALPRSCSVPPTAGWPVG